MIKSFRINGICCSECAKTIESTLKQIHGISDASFSLMTGRLKLRFTDDLAPIIVDRCEGIIREIEPDARIIS